MLLVLPIAIPLALAAFGMVIRGWRRLQSAMAVLASASILAIAVAVLVTVREHGPQALQVGGWPAPYGITLVADTLSALLLVITGVIGLAVAVYAIADVGGTRVRLGWFPAYNVLLAGVCGAFLTGDLFNLYVWFEVMLVASFVLLTLGSETGQVEGAVKYVTLNLVSSALFLAGVGMIYGLTGSLNLADLAQRIPGHPRQTYLAAASLLLLVAFGIKAAMFPLFFWLPASYHTPPAAVSAVFAGLLTKVGVYSLLRVFTLLFPEPFGPAHALILGASGFTMLSGVLGAAAQGEFRRILGFHIVSQIGYMLLGLGLFATAGLAATVFFVLHNILAKSSLFLVSGAANRFGGSFDLGALGALDRSRPALSLLFLVPALSLAGVPPLSGFVAKLLVIRAGLADGQPLLVAVALLVGFLTLYSMTKIWIEAFWKPRPRDAGPPPPPPGFRERALLMAPSAVLAVLIVWMGILPGTVFDLSNAAAQELLEPSVYVEAVLGASR